MPSRSPRAAALAAALALATAPAACAARSPAVAAPPAGPSTRVEDPLELSGPLAKGQVPDCPPTPSQPHAGPARCGNGRIDVAWELIAAPCIPGRCCASGWAPRPLEACDGEDLGGATCGARGFLGGTLRCTGRCELDASGCTASPAGARTVRIPGLVAAGASLALDGGTLAIATVEAGALRVRTLDPRTLEPLVPDRSSGPACAPRAPPPGDRALLVPLRDGWLAALGCGVGTRVFRVPRSGPLEPLGDGRAAIPLFLARGAPGVLLGLEPHISGYPLELVRLDSEGHPRWEPVRAVVAARPTFGNPAAAAWMGGEWLAVSSSSAAQEAPPRTELFAARVTEDGAVRASRALGAGGRSVAVASDGARAFAVVVAWNGLFAIDLVDALIRERPSALQLAPEPEPDRFERVLAAELSGGALTAWVTAERAPAGGAGAPVRSAYRVRAMPGGAAEPPLRVLAAPGVVPTAAAFGTDGAAYLLAADGEGGGILTLVR